METLSPADALKKHVLTIYFLGRYLTGQTTAAGKIPPCKVLVIGAGVAGT